MKNHTAISRRIESCINYTNVRNYESALINFFPALDKTAKKRRHREGVGSRIKKFLADQEEIITAVSTGNIFKNNKINGINFPEAIYKFGRTSISHEGELDDRLNFNDNGILTIGDAWNLPSSYITGLCIGVIVAPENSNEFIESPLGITLYGEKFEINELWGAEETVKQLISDVFQQPNLFSYEN